MSDTKAADISRETHDALLEKALKDATSQTSANLERTTQEVAALTAQLDEAKSKLAGALADNVRLNGDLDSAQVALKSATDEVAALKGDIAAREAAKVKAEVASRRAEQVENLGLFAKDYISEKASRWADMADGEWTERLEEWRQLKPATDSTAAPKATETASAMTGTTGQLTSVGPDDTASNHGSARRRALGLA